MKATNTAATPNEHPPLARDAQGNLVEVPAGTCAWRISRNTKGRPRTINGPDKQPARFPLDTTVDELADSCGADTYRIYALDDVGNVIEYVTTVETSREYRNASEPDALLVPARGSSTSSDLRYALEAVAHIARTNAEAMRAVAESQAEWIKSISSARGFFRNAPTLQLPAPSEEPASNDDEDDDVSRTKTGWIETIQPIVGMVVQQLVASMMGGTKPAGEPTTKWQPSDMLDWRRAARKHDEKASTLAPAAPDLAVDPVAMRQALIGKATAINELLEPAERDRLMKLAPALMKYATDPEISKIIAQFVSMSVPDSVVWLRANIDEIERGLAS